MAYPLWLQNFISVYSELGTENLSSLEHIYHPKVEFLDPIHRVEGFEHLLAYFRQLYTQVSSCDFKIEEVIVADSQAAIYWTMTYRHKQLNGGEAITVEGHSRLKARDNKVIYHRDYIDIGAMLYEHIPLIGGVIKMIKRRAAN
ncbi:nuclear transport factor 2 family protein [Shewanella colwelliana]|uniref:nuclear transport factor 2 family protein n=1 Tax=Shewanella colwelliana TaxID=23 RepID=UPI0022AF23E6|nr:nuclear transport factor 2 family protein [Shewanella colwelliana]MCZ4336632.1 nuclear transport factor 2 family protein [Shewanella colwelliana]